MLKSNPKEVLKEKANIPPYPKNSSTANIIVLQGDHQQLDVYPSHPSLNTETHINMYTHMCFRLLFL